LSLRSESGFGTDESVIERFRGAVFEEARWLAGGLS